MKDYTLTPNEYLSDMALTVKAKYLLCVLIRHCGARTYCWPTQKSLSKSMSCSTRTVRKYLTELEQHGYITKTRKGFNLPNIYSVKNRLKDSDTEDVTWTGSPSIEHISRQKETDTVTENAMRKDASPHIGKDLPNISGKNVPPNIKNSILSINTKSQDDNKNIEILRDKLKELKLIK